MTINQGLGGPKANPKGVTDGQPVNIPALAHHFQTITKVSSLGGLLDYHLYPKEKSKGNEKSELRFWQLK